MRAALIAVLTIAGLMLLVPAAQAFTEVTVAAREAPECPPGEQKIYCLTVIDGQLDGVRQGEAVALTLINQGQAPHNAYVTLGAQADTSTRETPADAAFANTTTISPGEQTNVSFIVPEDAESLYLWCEVSNHERLGMWLEVTVEPAQGPGNGTDDGQAGNTTDDREQPPETEPEGVPLPTWAPLAGLLAGAIVARARRS